MVSVAKDIEQGLLNGTLDLYETDEMADMREMFEYLYRRSPLMVLIKLIFPLVILGFGIILVVSSLFASFQESMPFYLYLCALLYLVGLVIIFSIRKAGASMFGKSKKSITRR